MADIEKWITINGVHIPIIKGESRAKAVSNFIKGKQKARKSKIRNKLKGALREPNSPKAKELLKNSTNYITKSENPTIRGFKTREELDRRYNEAYNKGEDLRDSYSERLQPLKDMPNKWDKESDRIHRQYKQAFMSKYKMKTLTPREKRIAERENIRGKLKDANTIYADGKKFEKVTNGKHSFTEYKSGGINWGEDTLINRIQNSKKVKYKK